MAVASGGWCGVEGESVLGASADDGRRAGANGLPLALALVPMGRADACVAGGDVGERCSLASPPAAADAGARGCESFSLPLDLALALVLELALDGAGLSEEEDEELVPSRRLPCVTAPDAPVTTEAGEPRTARR